MKTTKTIVNSNLFSLSTVMLFTLGTVFLWFHASSNVSSFVYFFVLWCLYLVVAYISEHNKLVGSLRKWVFLSVLFYPLLLVGISGIMRTQGTAAVHDNVLQMSAAVNFLLNSKNPYTHDYLDTMLAEQTFIVTNTGDTFVNPSLFHAVKMPLHLLLPTVGYVVLGEFDVRWMYMGLFLVSILLVFFMIPKYKWAYLFAVLFGLNPMMATFTLGGRDDIFVLFWIVLTLFLLVRKKMYLASFSMGLALVSKHSAWLMLPFLLAYLYFSVESGGIKLRLRQVVKWSLPAIVVTLVFLTPFIVWDAGSMWQDLVAYPAGTLETSFPINGYGLTNYLLQNGFIDSMYDYFPSWIPQLIVGIPLMIGFVILQRKSNSLGTTMRSYAIFMFAYWFFSRFFHDNYVGYVSELLILGVFVSGDIELFEMS